VTDDPHQSSYFHGLPRSERLKIARHGWPNWYINRGRMSNPPTDTERRQVSWRRAH
jgi:hypothetical protein